jgi:hypothetical protein
VLCDLVLLAFVVTIALATATRALYKSVWL